MADHCLPLTLFVPGVPAAKGRPRFTRSGRPYTPARTWNAELSIARAAKAEMVGRPLLEGPLKLSVIASYPAPKRARRAMLAPDAVFKVTRPDTDNVLKLLCDALNGVVWTDDACVAVTEIAKIYADPPGLTISIKRADADEWPFTPGGTGPGLLVGTAPQQQEQAA